LHSNGLHQANDKQLNIESHHHAQYNQRQKVGPDHSCMASSFKDLCPCPPLFSRLCETKSYWNSFLNEDDMNHLSFVDDTVLPRS
jgi:hypothetical protein